jgi:hypothetical protein
MFFPGSLAEIDAETSVLDLASRTNSTWTAYKCAWDKFARFTLEYDLPMMPSDPETVRRYLSFLFLSGKKTASANMVAAAIKAYHELAGFASPTDDAGVARSLKSIKRLTGTPAKQAEPTTMAILVELIDKNLGFAMAKRPGANDPHLTVWRNVWFEVTAFATLARFSDLQHVTRQDVLVTKESVTILFDTRKNDQGHLGHRATMYAIGGRYCPVRLTRRYLARLPDHPDTPLLPAWGSSKSAAGHSSSAALPVIGYEAMRAAQIRIFDAAGLPGKLFGLHSGRVGGSYALFDMKWKWEEIGEYGGWTPGSRAPQNYCRQALRQQAEMFGKIYVPSKKSRG